MADNNCTDLGWFSSATFFKFRSGAGMIAAVVGMAFVFGGQRGHAQAAPGLLWVTNVNARLFAVDDQTNSYAAMNGTVVTLDAGGVPFKTNSICPVSSIAPGVSVRDSAGNFYFAGNFDGTHDFGGTNLVGGWINGVNYYPPRWQPGYPTCFLAKYDPSGLLLWATSFGLQAISNHVSDLVLNADNSVTVGIDQNAYSAQISQFSANGNNLWQSGLPGSQFNCGPVKVSSLIGTNGGFLMYQSIGRYISHGHYDVSGGVAFNPLPSPPPSFSSDFSMNGEPVITPDREVYVAGLETSGSVLEKVSFDGAIEFSNSIGSIEQTILGGDAAGNLYLSGIDGTFSQYNAAGVKIWTTNYGAAAVKLVIDSSGNRFLQLENNTIARLSADSLPQGPFFTETPTSETVFVGDNTALNVTVDGTPPFFYVWQFNGTNLPAATNAMLTLNSIASDQAGPYTVVVSNPANSVTSSPPAIVRVKSVELYLGSQLLTNGTYAFATSPVFTVRSAFTNGSIFYTLDGSTPSFNSTFYSGPFSLSQSAMVRAIGYSADFSQSEEADPVNAIVTAQYTLTVTSSGGGHVTLNPPGGDYASSITVTATAVPDTGWTFLYWTGDASGSTPSVDISMISNKSIHAVFGTTLSTTVQGNGQIDLYPPGGLYSYGQIVRLTAVPGTGSYFGFWGNAATGNTNPLYFTVTNPTPTVSSIFGTNSANQVTLAVNLNGGGTVAVNPRANVYNSGQSLTLTATPSAGQSFVNWSGDASGSQNPLNITLNQSEVINANFTGGPFLRVDPQMGEGLHPEGFRFSLVSDPGSIYEIRSSSNLTTWQSLGFVTNNLGETQILDTNAIGSQVKFYRFAP